MPFWIQWITFGIAVVGATLGLFNAYWMIRRDTVRISVQAVTLYVPALDVFVPGISVANLGYLDVTLTEVAFRGGQLKSKRAIIKEDYFGSTSLPLRMQPRTSVTIAGDPGLQLQLDRWRATHCSASTACGTVVKARIRGQKR